MAGTVDATGLDCYLVATSVVTTTKAECTTAIAAGKRIGKLKSLGDIGGSRAITEHKYLSNDDSEKSAGSVSYGNISLEMPFSSGDTAGQAELRSMFANKTRMKMIIAETDGNFTALPILTSDSKKGYAIDDFVLYKVTVEQDGSELNIIA